MNHLRSTTLGAATALLAALACAAPAGALPTCGSLGQPTCIEDPPPGKTLTLTSAENPYALAPLATRPSASQPLWPRVRGHQQYGFNAVMAGHNGTSISDEALLHQAIGASMARVNADWAMIQYYPNRNEGGPSWDYTWLDAQYRAYVARGVRPLLSIVRTPRRFTNRASTTHNSSVTGCGTSDACWNPPRTDALSRLKTFATDLAKRYPLAAGIEVWNEPNLSNPFWGGEAPDPARYTGMLTTVYQAVRKVTQRVPVLGGAISWVSTSGVDAYGYQRAALRGYLKEMLKAGAAASMDALSFHPYIGSYPTTTDPGAQASDLFNRIAAPSTQIAGAYADAGQSIGERLVASEFGVSTTDGYTEEQQSYWLRMQYVLWDTDNTNLPLSSRTDAAFIHAAVEEPTAPNARQIGLGLTHVKDAAGTFVPKLAFCDFRTGYGGFSACPASFASAG